MIKAKCIIDDKRLAGIFDSGDSVNIESLPYTEDTRLAREIDKFVFESGQWKIVVPNEYTGIKLIAPKGSYKTYHIKSKNGNYYSEHDLYCIIGHKQLSEMFTKINA